MSNINSSVYNIASGLHTRKDARFRTAALPRKPRMLPLGPTEGVRPIRKESISERLFATDEDLLGMFLRSVTPQPNVRQTARALLRNFGTFERVVNTTASALMVIAGMTRADAVALKSVGQAALYMFCDAGFGGPKIESEGDLVRFLTVRSIQRRIGSLYVVFLDENHRVIADEEIHPNTVSPVPNNAREIIRRSLELDAPNLILITHLTTEDTRPTRRALQSTRDFIAAAELLSICILDHIFRRHGGEHFSFNTEIHRLKSFHDPLAPEY